MESRDLRKSKIALGVFVISIMALFETVIADRHHPNPASPVVWAALSAVGLVSLIASVWFRVKAGAQRP